MEPTRTPESQADKRPKRADARRNHDKIVAAARDAFAEGGAATALDQIARRAEVGPGTLYRHFATRQELLEAVYVDEVEDLCRSAADLAELPAWDALAGWLRRLVGYLQTKQALAPELLTYFDRDAEFFKTSRAALWAAGEPLVARAQEAHALRADTDLTEIIQMVGGIAKIPAEDPAQIEHILEMALDGLRYRAPQA
jgi:AcrR family transcriptional regulator